MCETDSVGAIDVKWLSLCVCTTASCGISKVTNTHEAREFCCSLAIQKDTRCHTIAFALEYPTTFGNAGGNSTSIL